MSSWHRNRFRYLAGLLTVTAAWPAPAADTLVPEVHVSAVDLAAGRVQITWPQPRDLPPGSRLVLADDVRPACWAELDRADGAVADFTLDGADVAALPVNARWRAWLVPPDLVARARDAWPEDAELGAPIDSLGPGGQSAWVRAGEQAGIAVGDVWWLRVGGQPVARFDVRLTDRTSCFCAVTALVSAAPLRAGERVLLWPGPGQRRQGRVVSAVSYVEDEPEGGLIWIAAPPEAPACPPEPHVEFFRDGQYVGDGLVERRDSRFWYARLTRAAPAAAPASAAEVGGAPAGAGRAPGAPAVPAGKATGVRVGDDVRVRRVADVAEGRIVPRVFELTAGGALVNAGEGDGLAGGAVATAYRCGVPLGPVRVQRAQRSYAVVRPVPAEDGASFALRVGDELRLVPPPPPPVRVGTVTDVVGETLFAARLATGDPPLLAPLAVRRAGRTVGAAILLARRASTAGGLILPGSMAGRPGPGLELVCEPAAARPAGGAAAPGGGEGTPVAGGSAGGGSR